MRNRRYKMKEELSVSIDEITLMLFPTKENSILDWDENRKEMIQIFLGNSKLEELYGETVQADKSQQQGYTYSLIFPDKPFHFCISWHEIFGNMGICVHFSALAWATYQTDFFGKYNEKTNVADFLRMVQSESYVTRLSRIDFVADYKNFSPSVSPDVIYRGLTEESLTVRDCENRNLIGTKEGLNKEGEYHTIYLGSKKNHSRCFCRIYDKRIEQMQGMKSYYQEAVECESWIRHEVVFRQIYAQQITGELLENVHTEYELQGFIAQKITEKYRFYEEGSSEPTEYTKALMGLIGNQQFSRLRNPSPRDNDLKSSIKYLRNGSGLYPVLYKISCIWGNDAVKKLLELLYAEYDGKYKKEASKKKDIFLWLKKHQANLKNEQLEDYF